MAQIIKEAGIATGRRWSTPAQPVNRGYHTMRHGCASGRDPGRPLLHGQCACEQNGRRVRGESDRIDVHAGRDRGEVVRHPLSKDVGVPYAQLTAERFVSGDDVGHSSQGRGCGTCKQREAREKDRRQNQKLITSSPRRLPAATKGAHPSGSRLTTRSRHGWPGGGADLRPYSAAAFSLAGSTLRHPRKVIPLCWTITSSGLDEHPHTRT
jgi:hypothetical protein